MPHERVRAHVRTRTSKTQRDGPDAPRSGSVAPAVRRAKVKKREKKREGPALGDLPQPDVARVVAGDDDAAAVAVDLRPGVVEEEHRRHLFTGKTCKICMRRRVFFFDGVAY